MFGYADTAVAFRTYELRGSDDTQAAACGPLIAAAGNDAVTHYIGTVGECHRAAEAELEAERIRWAENERERDRIIAEASGGRISQCTAATATASATSADRRVL